MSIVVVMARKLPPLNALKSFEAAGRLLSFTRAADELNVTQAAVSHQIKALEEHFGLPLFTRYARTLALTEQGKKLLPEVTEAFDSISAAIGSLGPETVSNTVSVRLAPSLAAKWISPRLKYFWMQHPEIDLSMYHAHPAVDFSREDIDIAVTYGHGKWPDVIAEPLMALDFFPVCAPEFLATDKPVNDIDNLSYYTLLHDGGFDSWNDWLTLAGKESMTPTKGILIDDTNVIIQMAIDGQGIAMASTLFVSDYLKNGQLIKPFDVVLENDFSYYVVCPERSLEKPAVRYFRNWLLSLDINDARS